MGPYLVFLASTVNGYEGTGRSLTLKFIQQLRQSTLRPTSTGGSGKGRGGGWHTSSEGRTAARRAEKAAAAASAAGAGSGGPGRRSLKEIALEEPIRYAPGDAVEAWLNRLLCLDATSPYRIVTALPPPSACELFLVNRDALFSHHALSEAMLHRLMSLFVSSHYRNSPNDLQLMSDAPAHRLFALLGPTPAGGEGLPDVLCVIQRSSGDLIPWTMSQQFLDKGFPSLSGARIGGYVPVYLRQTANELTAEHTCIMLRELDGEGLPDAPERGWTSSFAADFSRRFLSLCGSAFRSFPASTALLVGDTAAHSLAKAKEAYALEHGLVPTGPGGQAKAAPSGPTPAQAAAAADSRLHWRPLGAEELELLLTGHDLQRLDSYARNLVDYHMITDLVPLLASLYFTHRMPGLSLSRLQCALLMAVGAQRRSVDAVEEDLNVPAKQLLALFNKAVRKVSKHLRGLQEKAVDATIPGGKGASAPTTPGKTSSKPKKSAKKAAAQHMEQYEVRGSDSAWAAAEAAVAAI
ncbi:KRE33, partial [Symbiodinium sp. KB8]